MSFPITGGDADDRGPVGCVTRFILAGEAGDQAAAAAELHPDCMEGVSGNVSSPPGIQAVTLEEPVPVDGGVQVPANLLGPDGSTMCFRFVVRPAGERWGLDLPGSLTATFGGDPLQMMGDALKQAVQPLGDALQAVGDAMSDAFGGSSGGGMNDGPTARRLAPDEALPNSTASAPSELTAVLTELDLHRRLCRDEQAEALVPTTELSVRLRFDLDPAWSASACRGVTISSATALTGEDLTPQDAYPDLGSESYASWERERRDFTSRFALAAPQKPFTGLKELTGTVRLALTGGELFEIALGPVSDLFDRPIVLTAFGIEVAIYRDENGSLVLKSPSGWTDRLAEIRPIDATGESISESWSGSDDGETNTRTYGSDIPDDASLVIRFWSQSVEAEIPFTITGLPAKLD